MKKIFFCALWFASNLWAGCPYFTEFFPDPSDRPDAEGEYLEIRLASEPAMYDDTLWIQMEDKPEIAFSHLSGKRLLLHRDTLSCPQRSDSDCRLLPFPAMPNSREVVWQLRQGNCLDSVFLPVPKSGKALERTSPQNSIWAFTIGTPGRGNASYEPDVYDCALSLRSVQENKDSFVVTVELSGCDSAIVFYKTETLDLRARADSSFQLLQRAPTEIFIPKQNVSLEWMANLSPDENSENDSVKTFLIMSEHSPIQISEIHFCPEEGNSEWIEIYNASPRPLPLAAFSFCGRGLLYVQKTDSLGAYESVLLARDTLLLRQEIGFQEVRIFRATFGTLKNSGDTLSLCVQNVMSKNVENQTISKKSILFFSDTILTIFWDKTKNEVCPFGFNPETGARENTPGFQGRKSIQKKNSTPFQLEWNTRVVSKRHTENPQIRFFNIWQNAAVRLVLLSENGQKIWEREERVSENAWISIPLLKEKPGVYFLKCKMGNYEKTLGLVLRP